AAIVIFDQGEIRRRREGLVARLRGRRQEEEREPNGSEPDEAHRSSLKTSLRLAPQPASLTGSGSVGNLSQNFGDSAPQPLFPGREADGRLVERLLGARL